MVKLRERAGSVPSTLVMLICAVRVCDALPQAHLSSDMRTLLGPPTSSVMLESKQGRCSAGVAAGGRGGGVREGCSLLAMRGGSDYAGMASSAAAFATPEVAKSVITSVSGSSVLTNPRNIGAPPTPRCSSHPPDGTGHRIIVSTCRLARCISEDGIPAPFNEKKCPPNTIEPNTLLNPKGSSPRGQG